MLLVNEHFSILILDSLPLFNIVDHFLLFKILSSLAFCDNTHRHTHLLLLFYPSANYFISFSFSFFLLTSKWHFPRLGFKLFSLLILYSLPRQCYTHQMLPSSTINFMQMTPKFMWLAQISTLGCRLVYPTIFSSPFLGCIRGI